MDPETMLEEARALFPDLVAEFERLRLWVGTCVGSDVAAWDGPKVDG